MGADPAAWRRRSGRRWRRSLASAARRTRRLDPPLRGLLWAVLAGVLFAFLNATMRALTRQLDPFQVQFLRYAMGFAVWLPLMLRSGFAAWRPRHVGGQFARGIVHTLGLSLWFYAVPHIPLADTTAIGFTVPLFVMLGAAWLLGEPMRWERWLASAIGFFGVLIVLAPQLGGSAGHHALVMLASSPVFAASYLITKQLTRHERSEVIVAWQSITVALFSLPLALPGWQWPDAAQWLALAACGLLGSSGHYCLARSFAATDISATQSVKFLDLVWAALLGWLVFADLPSESTLLGGLVICAATFWIARREAQGAIKR